MAKEDSLSDEQLIDYYLSNGSQTSLQELCERYEKKVFSKCYSMTKSREVAEDLRQDIMLKMIDKLHLYKGLSLFSLILVALIPE
mgnify:CR=1 FL=1